MTFCFLVSIAPLICAQTKREEGKDLPPGTYAVFETSMGTIVCRLFTDKTPKTTANFIGLAEGTREWKDPKTGQKVKKPFYDGIAFHRVIPNFMIQGGCPLGTGRGGPGYTFDDEFHPDLLHDKPGILSMANAGPNTNGSQFFITEAPTPHLNASMEKGVMRGHAVFGEVVQGLDVVRKITRVERDENDKPLQPIVIKKLTINRIQGAVSAPTAAPKEESQIRRPSTTTETDYTKSETNYGKK
jgi:peptidyl-prolyl cis-trans isomerase A (cyclophilin A)